MTDDKDLAERDGKKIMALTEGEFCNRFVREGNWGKCLTDNCSVNPKECKYPKSCEKLMARGIKVEYV